MNCSDQEEVLQAVHDGVNGEDGFPVFAEDVKTDVPFQIDVGMVNLSVTLHLQ